MPPEDEEAGAEMDPAEEPPEEDLSDHASDANDGDANDGDANDEDAQIEEAPIKEAPIEDAPSLPVGQQMGDMVEVIKGLMRAQQRQFGAEDADEYEAALNGPTDWHSRGARDFERQLPARVRSYGGKLPNSAVTLNKYARILGCFDRWRCEPARVAKRSKAKAPGTLEAPTMAEVRAWMGEAVTKSGTNAAKAALRLWYGKTLGRIAPNIWAGVVGGKGGKGPQRSRIPTTEAEMLDWFRKAVALAHQRPRFRRGVLIYRWLYEGALRKQDMQRISMSDLKPTATGNWQLLWEQQKTVARRGMVVSADLRDATVAFRGAQEKERAEARKARDEEAKKAKEEEARENRQPVKHLRGVKKQDDAMEEPLDGPLFKGTLLGTYYTVVYHTVELQKEMAIKYPAHPVTAGLNPHYMRHCRLTHLSKKVGDGELQDFSGHGARSSLRKYVHSAADKALEVVEAVALEPILSGAGKRKQKQHRKEEAIPEGKEDALPGAEGSQRLSEAINPELLQRLQREFGRPDPPPALWVLGSGPLVEEQHRLFKQLGAGAYFYLDHDGAEMAEAARCFPRT